MQERSIAFVGFRHQVAGTAQLGIGAGAVELATNHEGRVQPRLTQHRGNQAGCGGLTMGAGHCNAVAVAHDFRQHFRPGHNRHPAAAGRCHFRVITAHGGGHHHHVCPGAVLGTVADLHFHAHGPKPVCYRAFLDVGTGHVVALVLQYFGNTAHAGTADADKVDMANSAHFRHLVHQRRIVCISHWRPPDSNSRLSPLHRDGPASARPAPFPEFFPGHRTTLSGCRPVPRG